MPVTIVDRVPLPNLKVYSAGSVLLLSAAVYYAVSVTSDPKWRANATLQQHDAPDAALNSSRTFADQCLEVFSFMMQEPLCMWTVVNACGWAWWSVARGAARAALGRVRAAEARRLKDKAWNYVFYKFMFVFGVLNVHYLHELLLWCAWFALLGALLLLAHLAADRFDYVSSGGAGAGGWGRAAALAGGVLVAALLLLAAAARWALPLGRDVFAFMAAECVVAAVASAHVVARAWLRARDADPAAPLAYYTHLFFDSLGLAVEGCAVAGQVWATSALASLAALVLLLQLRHVLHALLARLRRHRLYAALAQHMSRNYPMASAEEVRKHEDKCAICWEPMREARKLPCNHLFHNSCLCRWVQQDASCPTCRRALSARAPAAPPAPPAPLNPLQPLTHIGSDPPTPNHLFHFDGSRYVSWLPSFSVEVTRVRADPAAPATTTTPTTTATTAADLDPMVAQVLAVFPQHSEAAVRADLARTRSPPLTIDNILEGRVPHPAAPTAAPPTPAAPPAPAPAAPHFPGSAAEREEVLRARRQQLLQEARARYLRRLAAAPHP